MIFEFQRWNGLQMYAYVAKMIIPFSVIPFSMVRENSDRKKYRNRTVIQTINLDENSIIPLIFLPMINEAG